MSSIIAVSGAQGVGKTTFCGDLRDALQERVDGCKAQILGGVARDLMRTGVSVDARTQPDQYPLFLTRHVENLIRTSADCDFIILDRTMVDTIAYARVNGNLNSNWLIFAELVASTLLVRIGHYFFLKAEFALEDDGVRCCDTIYQDRVEETMLDTIQRLYPRFTPIGGDRTQRVKKALSEICLCKK